MASIDDLMARIDAELDASSAKIEALRREKVREYREREARTRRVVAAIDRLAGIWIPRLQALEAKFGEKLEVKPKITPHSREALLSFKSPLASIELRFSARASLDGDKIVLGYDLDILPIFIEFEKRAELEQPIDDVDEEAVAAWMDERILQFVKTYVAVHEDPHYLSTHMVTDPVAGVEFPACFAVSTKKTPDGRTLHFGSDETREEWERRHRAGGS
jgi:hypothetical protein